MMVMMMMTTILLITTITNDTDNDNANDNDHDNDDNTNSGFHRKNLANPHADPGISCHWCCQHETDLVNSGQLRS